VTQCCLEKYVRVKQHLLAFECSNRGRGVGTRQGEAILLIAPTHSSIEYLTQGDSWIGRQGCKERRNLRIDAHETLVDIKRVVALVRTPGLDLCWCLALECDVGFSFSGNCKAIQCSHIADHAEDLVQRLRQWVHSIIEVSRCRLV
jgi:hypothetical protein